MKTKDKQKQNKMEIKDKKQTKKKQKLPGMIKGGDLWKELPKAIITLVNEFGVISIGSIELELTKPGAWRQPKEVALYRIAAKQEPGLFGILNMSIALWLTSRKPKEQTSGKLMAWYKIKAIELTGFKSKIWDFFKKRFDKKMQVMYNNECYIEDLYKIYYKANPEHPFHALVEGLK